MSSEPHLPAIGELVDGKYRIDALIGEGGMGVVFAGTHVQMDKRRAIKWLLPRLARDENAVRRFLAEAKIASRIDHPNVVSPIDVSVDAGAPYIVMELLEGDTLHAFLRDQPLALDEVGRIFMPILGGVAAAHAQKVVHRDLKPSNVFLVRSAAGVLVPKVLDFGIAKVIDGEQTQGTLTDHGAMLGTIQYMSPEQIEDARKVGPAADVYALGVILYRMLAGKLPYEGNLLDLVLRIHAGNAVPLNRLVAGLPSGLDEVVRKAFAPSLERRFEDVLSFARALLPYFPQYASVVPSLQPAPGSQPPLAATPAPDSKRLPPRTAPSGENSTFHPVVTGTRPNKAYRAWAVFAVLGLIVLAIGIASKAWPSDHGPGTRASAGLAAPLPPKGAAEPGAVTQPPAPINVPQRDAGSPELAAPGWQEVGSGVPVTEPPSAAPPSAQVPAVTHAPAEDDRRSERRKPKKPPPGGSSSSKGGAANKPSDIDEREAAPDLGF